MGSFLRPSWLQMTATIGILLIVPQAQTQAQAPYGQAPYRPAAPQLRKLHPNDGRGTVESVGQGMLRLRLKEGELWHVVPARTATIEVVGTASRELLQPGQFIICGVKIDEFGKVIEPAARITFPGGGVPSIVAGGLGLVDPGVKRISGRRPAGSYMLAGNIQLVQDAVVTMQIGNEKFEITVPADAELLVHTRNFSLAAPGDIVAVRGEYYQRGQLSATLLKITLAQPVMLPTKNKTFPTPAKLTP
ncbi:MAG: hypothetical protein NT089_00390 [Planctomycetia bacterium]|nr:hypothetical protein [Planctomycetia bacterium]